MFKNVASLESDSKSYCPKISQPNILLNGAVYSTNLLTSETKAFQIKCPF